MLALLVLLSLAPESVGAPAPGLFTRDLTGTLSAHTVSQLEAIAHRLDASGRGPLGIALIHTPDGRVPRAFATRMFNHWSKCSARTSSTTTLTYASQHSGGLGQIAESCQSCSYRNTYTRMTERLSSSSSSDSSSSSSSDSFGGGGSSSDGSSSSW